MPIIIDARETRPEVLELAARAQRAEAAAHPVARRLWARIVAVIARLRRALGA